MAVVCLDWVLQARSNNGAGPDLMMENVHGEDSVHAYTLRTTLGEHKQHCSSLLVRPIFQLYGTTLEMLMKHFWCSICKATSISGHNSSKIYLCYSSRITRTAGSRSRILSPFHCVVFVNQSLKNQLEATMPGMEAVITNLRERVDGPDAVAASRAAQGALMGFSKSCQLISTFRVSAISYYFHQYVLNNHTDVILLFYFLPFLLILRGFFSLQEEGTEQSVGEVGNTFTVPLELVPPSPALKLPYMSPSSIGGFTHSKAALSGVTSMPSLDVLQEKEGLDGNGAYWNVGNDLSEGMTYLSC